jgi:tripartite-type tricarboxylate transporter receptor subunit TctC
MRIRCVLLIAAGTAFAPFAISAGDEYPSRPIRILAGTAAGGSADLSARLAAEALGRVLHNPVFVELRGGAGGLNAVETYLSSEPDGYTLLLAAVGSFTIIPAAKRVSYDVERDFVPLGIVWRSAQVLSVRSDRGAKSLADFVANAKAHPGTVTVGSAGIGTVTHLTTELLKREAGINVIQVPYRGSGAALPALLGGQIDALVSDIGVIAPQASTGLLRPLAVAAPERVHALPDVPTMGEAGFPGVTGEIWFGLVTSAKTPANVVKRLQDALAIAHEDASYKEKLQRQYADAGPPGSEPLARLIATEAAKWHAIIRDAKIKFD